MGAKLQDYMDSVHGYFIQILERHDELFSAQNTSLETRISALQILCLYSGLTIIPGFLRSK